MQRYRRCSVTYRHRIVQVSDEGGAGSEGDASGPVGTAGQELVERGSIKMGTNLDGFYEELDDPEFERGQVPEENFERLQDVDDSYNEAKVDRFSATTESLTKRIAVIRRGQRSPRHWRKF